MTKKLRDMIPGLASGFAAVMTSIAAHGAPPPDLSVSEWAAKHRIVSTESQSPWPGPWSHERAPLAIEPMDCLSDTDPCEDVVITGSAQTWKSEVGLNFEGWIIDHAPGPTLIILPTSEETKKYVRLKFQPTIAATPNLRKRVKSTVSRDASGSSMFFKKFPGGDATLTWATTSAGLQMISVRYLICEEISEWELEAGQRGDPLDQARKRTTRYEGRRKRLYLSTPGLKGACRITAEYEKSDQRKPYAKCPHCGAYQVLTWENLKVENEAAPYGAYFACTANGCAIEAKDRHKLLSLENCVWIKTYEGEDAPGPWFDECDLQKYRSRLSAGRFPGFSIWRAYIEGNSWDAIWDEWLEAKGSDEKEMVFFQQVLGLPWESAVDTPDNEKLYLRREPYDFRRVPPGGLVITGMADVQSNRLEYGVYAWGFGMEGWLIDAGILMGDPESKAVWAELDKVISRGYEMPSGRVQHIDAFGVDSGYLSNTVYQFTRARPKVFALDGRHGWTKPLMGVPTLQDVTISGKRRKNGVKLWPTGTWPLKTWAYGALRKTIDGPDSDGKWPLGCLHYPMEMAPEYFEQLTAEYVATEVGRDGYPRKVWKPRKGRPNEALDILVGARALASAPHLALDRLTPDQWARVASDRGAPLSKDQMDLAELWAPPTSETETSAPPPRRGRGVRGRVNI